jgi:regulatory protein
MKIVLSPLLTDLAWALASDFARGECMTGQRPRPISNDATANATGPGKSNPTDRRRRLKGLSEERLYQSALYYLGRYAASSASVRRVLRRRVTKYAQTDDVDVETAHGWIEAIIQRLVRSGILDDAGYADGRARSLFNRGLSMRMIRVKLSEKGLDRSIVDIAIENLLVEHQDADLKAALALARRRRLGPYRQEEKREALLKRDLSAMARAGFSFEIARRVIEARSVDALEGLGCDH